MVTIKVRVLNLQEPLQTRLTECAELKLQVGGLLGLGHNAWSPDKRRAELNSDKKNCKRD